MPVLTSNNSSPGLKKRARRSPTRTLFASQGRNPEYRYIKGLNHRERVDKILSDLQQEHRWTIKELLYYMVTENP